MRIDKYLKVSRLIKRRTVAKDAADAGRVEINDRVVKAGAEVNVGDTICIHFGNSDLRVKVLEVKEVVKKEEAINMYEII
jgi:ribosomal 50S subunit-recycling heat shock protein